MKNIFLVLPIGIALLASCGGNTNNDALNEIMETKDDFDEAAVSFEKGGATNGEEYFFGVQAEVVEIDMKLREVDNLDEMDATEEEFKAHYDEMLEMVEHCKTAMNLYTGNDWPKRQELHDLTVEWVDGIKALINDYLLALAKPMSIPDEEWTDDDIALYDAYAEAYDAYIEIDNRWVDFQYTYASANGFELSDEGIDMDALIEEDMNSH